MKNRDDWKKKQTTKFCVLRALVGKGGESADELRELDFFVFVFVKDAEESSEEWVLRQFWNGFKFIGRQSAAAVPVELLKSAIQTSQLIFCDCIFHK